MLVKLYGGSPAGRVFHNFMRIGKSLKMTCHGLKLTTQAETTS